MASIGDPAVTALLEQYVELRGEARATTEGADEQIDRLARKCLGQDTYPFRQPGEQRVKFVITPARVRHMKQ